MAVNYLEKITELYAFLSVDEGGEGVISMTSPDGLRTAMVAADKARLNSLMPVAKHLAKIYGMKIKLVKFTTRQEIEEINP